MGAELLLRQRVVVAADAFVELVIWRVPEPVPPSTHEFKYGLAYVVGGRCVLRYDNERGKGDHLMADFEADIARWNDEHGRT
ncbi:MAG: hypothetical protein GY953_04720 [bacterium]|nr:hypothetical protein [bacterium]